MLEQQCLRLFANACRLLHAADTSFLFGQRLWPGHYGASSALLEQADHLLHALELISAYRSLLSPLLTPVIHLDEHHLHLYWRDSCGADELTTFLLEASMTGIVALAEMGDKTQLLALVLAARFRKPWPIVLGILVATLVNHGLAGAVGAWVTTFVGPQVLRWILGASFIVMAVWMLIPDKLDEGEADGSPRWGVFGTTVVAFFLAEMGDKTQIATVMLAAQYNAYLWVVAGTTLGMMIANAPVVWLGERITRRVPIRAVHVVSAVIFLVLGVLALFLPGTGVLA